MTNPDFAELKRALCKIDDKSASDYLSRYMEGGYVEPTYQEYGEHVHTKSSAIISELIDIIQSQSEALETYHDNHYAPKLDECLSETNTRLQKLREGKL